MIDIQKLIPVCCLALAAGVAQAQTPVPAAPPAPPAPAVAPTPAPAPTPRAVRVLRLDDLDEQMAEARAALVASSADVAEANAALAANAVVLDFQDDRIREVLDLARVRSLTLDHPDVLQFARDQAVSLEDVQRLVAQAKRTPQPAIAPTAQGQGFGVWQPMVRRPSSVDGLYDKAQNALDSRRYDQALDYFSEVATRGGARADAALYWKAYTLNKLGRRDDAVAAITELRTKYASSHWLDDAKALEIEVKQASGQKVTPESQSDDELKLLALNGLVQSDPDRAFPILEKLLKSAQAPRLKKEAIYVLAQNSSPKAQQLLEQIARGGGNPDLQLQAIQYMGRTGKQANRGQVLVEIYNSTTDPNVKRGILNALVSSRDKDHLFQIAKSEKAADMRLDAIRMLGATADQGEVWQLYQAETDPTVKQQILSSMSGNSEKLLEVARTDKDPKLRLAAVRSLSSMKAPNVSESLVALYGSEQDPTVKRTIVNTLYNQRNVQALIALGRKEQDSDLKRDIVRRLVEMKSPEASQFLEEILK